MLSFAALHRASGTARSRRAALAGAMALAVALAACGSSGAGGDVGSADAQAAGAAAVDEFFTILQKPEAERGAALEKFLAPEFQVVRANGERQARADYLVASPSVTTFTITNVNVTQAGDSLVVAYQVVTEETIEGVAQQTTAPRLSTFRRIDGTWHLVAHANFGALQ